MSAEYEYRIVEGKQRDELSSHINAAAQNGWEPINAWSRSGGNESAGHHYALLRRSLKAA